MKKTRPDCITLHEKIKVLIAMQSVCEEYLSYEAACIKAFYFIFMILFER